MAYRSISSTTGVKPLNPGLPSGFAANDIVVLIASIDQSASLTMTWPTGFTQFFTPQQTTVDGHRFTMAWKRMDGTETTLSTTHSGGSTADMVVAAVCFSGRDTTNPPVANVANSNALGQTPLTVSATGVTASAGDDILFVSSPDVNSSGAGTGHTPPTNYTERADLEFGFTNVEVATRDNVSAGATGTVSATFTFSPNTVRSGYAASLVRIPVAGGGGGGGFTPNQASAFLTFNN